jgi:hypothetical protein
MSEHQNLEQSHSRSIASDQPPATTNPPDQPTSGNAKKVQPSDSYVKLAMRNMVKKGSTSFFHFFLTTVGVIAVLLGLAIAFH